MHAVTYIDISRDVKLRTIKLTRWWAVAVILAMWMQGVRESLTVMPRSLTMFVVGNETPFRQKEKVRLVLRFLLISKIQHFSIYKWPMQSVCLLESSRYLLPLGRFSVSSFSSSKASYHFLLFLCLMGLFSWTGLWEYIHYFIRA